MQIVSWLVTIVIVGLNAKLVVDEINGWLETTEHPIYIYTLILPLCVGAALLLLYIAFKPLLKKRALPVRERNMVPHITEANIQEIDNPILYKKIAVAVDFSTADSKSLSTALQLGGKSAVYTLIHVVETPGAIIYGESIEDYETSSDERFLSAYREELENKGYTVSMELGFGSPKRAIPVIINATEFDLLVLGSHGHKGFKDLIFGTTVDSVRHRINIPVFIA